MADIDLNRAGVTHASSLISSGKIDRDSPWSFSAADGNALLGDPENWTRYGSWHLGITPDDAAESKAHWHYPFGKDGKVYRGGLIAIRSRAAQQNDTEVFDAAGRMIVEIDKSKEKAMKAKIDKLHGDAKALIEKIDSADTLTDEHVAAVKALSRAVATLKATGAGGGTQQAGPGGQCVCPKCGEKVEHEQAKACKSMKCPKCGTEMQREGYEKSGTEKELEAIGKRLDALEGKGADPESHDPWPVDMNTPKPE